MELTGALPQLSKRTGADGKARSQPATKPKAPEKAKPAKAAAEAVVTDPVAKEQTGVDDIGGTVESAAPVQESNPVERPATKSPFVPTPTRPDYSGVTRVGQKFIEEAQTRGELAQPTPLSTSDILNAIEQLPFDAAIAVFTFWFSHLSDAKQGQVQAALEAIEPAARKSEAA